MKQILLIVFATILLMFLLPLNVKAACDGNQDWPEKPCLDVNPFPSLLKQKIMWEKYYEYKGSEWMEMKKSELDNEFQFGNLKEWTKESSSNRNVWYYYYLNAEAPKIANYEGKEPPLTAYLCQKDELIDLEHHFSSWRYNLVNYMCYHPQSKQIEVSIYAFEADYLSINIPRKLLDPKDQFCNDSNFIVHRNGKSIEVTDFISTPEYRSVKMELGEEENLIEVSEQYPEDSKFCLVKESQIPEWVRNNAEWWAQGAIGDSDFVSGIQYLIKEGIIQIPETAKSSTTGDSEEIPAWIKNNADWWAQGLISDDDFVKGIQCLVENGIIVI